MIKGMKFDIEGVNETISKLDFGIRKVNDQANTALNEGGEVVKNTIERNTPWLSGEAQSSVIKTGVKGGAGRKSVDIGYGSNVAWRMWFLEEGTYSKGNPKGIAPRKIVERSQEESHAPAEAIIADFIAQVINSL